MKITLLLSLLFFSIYASALDAYHLPVEGEILTVSHGTLTKKNNIFWMEASGTMAEMAHAHGVFAGKLVNADQSSLNVFMSTIHHTLERGLGKSMASLSSVLEAAFGRIFESNMSHDDKVMWDAFADGANLQPSQVHRAIVFPDEGEYLTALFAGKNHFMSEIPGLGCSTVVVKRNPAHPAMIMGRNLDFPSHGTYEKFALVMKLNPTEPGLLPHFVFTTLGLHAAHTAVNSAGIAMSLHQLVINDKSMTGDLILSIAWKVAARAKTAQDAKRIISAAHFTTSWRFIIASLRENKSFIADVSPGKIWFSDENRDFLAATNSAQDPFHRARQFYPTYRYGWDSQQRVKILMDNLKRARGSVTEILNLMSDHGDQNHITGMVPKLSNLMSVVFDLSNGVGYFGIPFTDMEKSSSGKYVRFPMSFSQSLIDSSAKSEVIQSSQAAKSSIRQAHAFIRTADFYIQRGASNSEALTYLYQAETLLPRNLDIQYLIALHELKAADQGNSFIQRAKGRFLNIMTGHSVRYFQNVSKYFYNQIVSLEDPRLALREINQLNGLETPKFESDVKIKIKLLEKAVADSKYFHLKFRQDLLSSWNKMSIVTLDSDLARF